MEKNLSAINEILMDLNEAKNDIFLESSNWWWLDFGDYPIMTIWKPVEVKRKVKWILTEKLSIKLAVLELIDSVDLLLKLPVTERDLKKFGENAQKLKDALEYIREAHEIIENLQSAVQLAQEIFSSEKAKKIEMLSKNLINQIAELFRRDYKSWPSMKSSVLKMAENIQNKVFSTTTAVKKIEEDIKRVEIGQSELAIFSTNEFLNDFISEIKKAKREIIIVSPFFKLTSTVRKVINALLETIKNGVIIKIYMYPKEAQRINDRDIEMIEKLRGLDIKIIEKNIHVKAAIIDNELLYFGSVNILSFSAFSKDIMIKTRNQKFVESYIAKLKQLGL